MRISLDVFQDVDSKDILRLGGGKLVREELRALTLNAKLAESNSVGDEFERAQRILKQTVRYYFMLSLFDYFILRSDYI